MRRSGSFWFRWSLLPLCLLILLGAAPLLSPHDPMQTNAEATLIPPMTAHLLGTDYLGRDVFSRLLYGGQRTLLVTTCAALLAMFTGCAIGILMGVMRTADILMSALLNAILALPTLVLALVILTLAGPGTETLILATGLAQTASVARIARITARTVYIQEYTLASVAQGGGQWHILRHHILRNAAPPLTIYGAIVFGYCLFNSAALNLLGITSTPGIPDWGTMVADGRHAFRQAPWVALAPGAAITAVIVYIHVLVDALNRR